MSQSSFKSAFYISLTYSSLTSAHSQVVLDSNSPSSRPFLYPALSNLSDIDISTPSIFSGLGTFAHLPYVNCFSESSSDSDSFPSYDIAFIGAPFDTGVTARPGARYGPEGIRSGSSRISADFAYDIETGYNPFKSWAKIVDCGSVPMTTFDNTYALAQLEKGYRVVSGRRAATAGEHEDEDNDGMRDAGRQSHRNGDKSIPRIVMLGGDHTVTLAALRSVHHHWGQVSVIHFDSHIDTWDPKVLGGGISDYSSVNHGTFLHIAHSEGLIHNTSIHAGIRSPVARRHGDLRNDQRCGFEIVTARAIDRIGVRGVIQQLRERVQGTKVYISVDIDVLDPAYAPGTGTPEVAGWTTRELLSILEGLEGLHVVGADVVEVAPAYDNRGQTTVLAAAEVAVELMTLMVGRE